MSTPMLPGPGGGSSLLPPMPLSGGASSMLTPMPVSGASSLLTPMPGGVMAFDGTPTDTQKKALSTCLTELGKHLSASLKISNACQAMCWD